MAGVLGGAPSSQAKNAAKSDRLKKQVAGD